MKREDDVRKEEYEWEADYQTKEIPLSAMDNVWLVIFRIILLAATLAALPRLLGFRYEELIEVVIG